MSSKLLEDLNPAQQKAVETIDGPVLVLAGPGSGKTRVLTHRVAYLIKEVGVDPFHILAVTFTNKAAREMKERLEHIVGGERAAALTIGTFHSLCVRFLRRDVVHLGRERDFAIYDSDDQQRLMRRVLRDMSLDEKKYPPRAIHSQISSAKNELVSPEEYARLNRASYYDEIVARCYERYQQVLRENNALDFDDLLVETVRLFSEHPTVLEKYQERYIFLLVDEYQDTNRAQYMLVRYLAAKRRNLFVVGDNDQCLPPGSLIQTPEGERPIEQFRTGDRVLAGAGRGTTAAAQVLAVRSRPYVGNLVRVTLADGTHLDLTPSHMCFARLGLREDVHYVYLMYRHDKGYRIGVAKGARSDGRRSNLVNGLQVRVNQEKADKLWVLRVCASRQEAAVYEQYYSVTYGIPTMVFFVAGRGAMNISQAEIDWLYTSIDTRTNAQHLLRDLGMYAEYPHYRPSAVHSVKKRHRVTVHMTAFGGNGPSMHAPWYRHRVWINTSDRFLEQQVLHNGIMSRPGNRQTWRVERSYKELERTSRMADTLSEAAGGADVARWAALTTNDKFAFQPAAHLRPTMIVPVWREGTIVDAEIANVETVRYEGLVYDLDVEHLHNYVAHSVVVHNSIYAWRGADVRNILQFEQDYPNAQVILLEQNYRSTQAILNVAQAVINAGVQHTHVKQLWTDNGAGVQVSLHEGYDQNDEAQWVADEIARLVASGDHQLGEVAVMYRTNAQSRALEEALITRGLRYQIVGGTRFYERKEVKDVLAYLRLVHNPFDSVSLERILNVPARGIGARTEEALFRWAAELGVPIYQALQELALEEEAQTTPQTKSPFNGRTRNNLLAFLRTFDSLREGREQRDLVALIDLVLERLSFRDNLLREHGPDEGEERWTNLLELRDVATEYINLPRETQLPTFLEEVALVADVDNLDRQADAITCITLHQAKGLEYPVVFLIGLEEGLLPHSRSMDEKDKLEEERRLLYVGATRAKAQLYLLYAFRRTSYGRTNISTPSRFLTSLPQELVKQPTKRDTVVSPQSSMFTQRGGFGMSPASSRARGGAASKRNTRRQPSGPTEISFVPGQQVRHSTFGEGVVVSSKLVEGDEEVTVNFTSKGQKRLLASFARLERVD